MCLALVFAVQKLQHYLLTHSVQLISYAEPIKYLMSRPILSGCLAKWALLLIEFDIMNVPQKAIKGQALADFLVAHPLPKGSPLNEDLLDDKFMLANEPAQWQMFFDGAFQASGPGASTLFVTLVKGFLSYVFSLNEKYSNNEAENKALIIGLDVTLELNLGHLNIFGNSQLIIRQLKGIYKIHNDELKPYNSTTRYLLGKMNEVTLTHIPHELNIQADALATLGATMNSVVKNAQCRIYVIVNVYCRTSVIVNVYCRTYVVVNAYCRTFVVVNA
ncbi:uncharacterized protein LOC105420632 [Amborella trichopoda]|uniref:uncharacterized protein LOC105420632 n=1 Tax=Amborella trichopoda TaxID=13333 RepID=UPI0005D2E72B|nr:uncharacterized protein LOC105420632 [Amborella trichopoda]|eukprot:XP_011623305.1 uncharacterized protein LOC105420632 [Amborella trichopoda]